MNPKLDDQATTHLNPPEGSGPEAIPPPPSLFTGASWLAASRLVSQIYSWIGTFYVASMLLPKDFGMATLATAFTEFAFVLSNMGIGATLIQRQETDKRKIDNLFTATLILGAVLAVGALFLAYPGARYFKNEALIHLTQFTALVYLFNAVSIVPYNFLNRDMRFKERGIIDLASVFLSISAQILMARAGYGVWTLMAAPALRFFCRMLLSFYYSGYRPSLFLNFAMLKEDLIFGMQITTNWFLFMLRDRSILIILGRFYTVAELGLLNLAGTLAAIPNQKVVQLLQEILLPAFSKRKGDHAGKISALTTAFRVMLVVVFPLYLCGFWYGRDVLLHVLHSQWAPMFPLFQVLCVVQVWGMFAGFVSTFITADGKPYKSTVYEVAMIAVIPAVTYLWHGLPMVAMAAVWGVLSFAIYLVWLCVVFRKEPAFLGRIFMLMLQVIGVCSLGFAVDYALARAFALPHDSLWATSARVAGFSLFYLAYLRIGHWSFLSQLRKK